MHGAPVDGELCAAPLLRGEPRSPLALLGGEPRATRSPLLGGEPRAARSPLLGGEPRAARSPLLGGEPRTARSPLLGGEPRREAAALRTDVPIVGTLSRLEVVALNNELEDLRGRLAIAEKLVAFGGASAAARAVWRWRRRSALTREYAAAKAELVMTAGAVHEAVKQLQTQVIDLSPALDAARREMSGALAALAAELASTQSHAAEEEAQHASRLELLNEERRAEAAEWQAERQRWQAERQRWQAEREQWQEERERWQEEQERWVAERQQHERECKALKQQHQQEGSRLANLAASAQASLATSALETLAQLRQKEQGALAEHATPTAEQAPRSMGAEEPAAGARAQCRESIQRSDIGEGAPAASGAADSACIACARASNGADASTPTGNLPTPPEQLPTSASDYLPVPTIQYLAEIVARAVERAAGQLQSHAMIDAVGEGPQAYGRRSGRRGVAGRTAQARCSCGDTRMPPDGQCVVPTGRDTRGRLNRAAGSAANGSAGGGEGGGGSGGSGGGGEGGANDDGVYTRTECFLDGAGASGDGGDSDDSGDCDDSDDSGDSGDCGDSDDSGDCGDCGDSDDIGDGCVYDPTAHGVACGRCGHWQGASAERSAIPRRRDSDRARPVASSAAALPSSSFVGGCRRLACTLAGPSSARQSHEWVEDRRVATAPRTQCMQPPWHVERSMAPEGNVARTRVRSAGRCYADVAERAERLQEFNRRRSQHRDRSRGYEYDFRDRSRSQTLEHGCRGAAQSVDSPVSRQLYQEPEDERDPTTGTASAITDAAPLANPRPPYACGDADDVGHWHAERQARPHDERSSTQSEQEQRALTDDSAPESLSSSSSSDDEGGRRLQVHTGNCKILL